MSADNRVLGAIDLDGSLWGQVVAHGVERPVVLFAHEGKNLTADPSWQNFWSNTAHATKIELQLHNSTEGSFTDFPLLAETIGGGKIPTGLQSLIGQVPGSVVDEVLNGYIGHFFQFCLNHASMPVLKNDSKVSAYVEVLKEVVKRRCRANCAEDL